MRVSAKTIQNLGRDPLRFVKHHVGTFKHMEVSEAREKRQSYAKRGCYLACNSSSVAEYRYSYETLNFIIDNVPKLVVEYQGKPVLLSSLSWEQRQRITRIDPEFCGYADHAHYSPQQFADEVCRKFGAGANTYASCVTIRDQQDVQMRCVGNATAPALPVNSSSASLGAIAIVPIVGLAIGVGIAAYAAYRYISRAKQKLVINPEIAPRPHLAEVVEHEYESTDDVPNSTELPKSPPSPKTETESIYEEIT